MLSVFFLVYNVEHTINEVGEFFEQFVVIVFITEYLLRAWLYSDSHRIIIEEYEKAKYLDTHFSLFKSLKRVFGKNLSTCYRCLPSLIYWQYYPATVH